MRNQEQWPDRKLEESRRRSDRFQGSDQYDRDDYRRRGGEDYQHSQGRNEDESDYFSGGDRGSQRYGGRGQQTGRSGGAYGRYGSDNQYGSQRHGQHHDDDYMHWRDEQIGKLDEDYKSWQGERRKKFADEFDKWRSERSTKAGSQTGTESTNTKK